MASWRALKDGPLMIVIGELLLAVCSLCYLVWWKITFNPSARAPSAGGPLLAGAPIGPSPPSRHRWSSGPRPNSLPASRCGRQGLCDPGVGRLDVDTAIATLVGLACYLVCYRLDPITGYRIGMVPRAVDTVAAATSASIAALARVP